METAWKKDVEYRKGLPLHFLQSTGFSRSPDYNSIRDQIIDKVKSLINKLPDYMDIDQAADEIGNTFVHSSLPPFMTDGMHFIIFNLFLNRKSSDNYVIFG